MARCHIFSQVSWHLVESTTSGGPPRVIVDGRAYMVGRGDPGTTVDGLCENNCLIDSLMQCLGIHTSCRDVRRDLLTEFASASGRARVAMHSYLDVEAHGRSIVRSLFFHNTNNLPPTCNVDDFYIVALSANNIGHGTTVGRRGAPYTLVVLNHHDMHFDPCIAV